MNYFIVNLIQSFLLNRITVNNLIYMEFFHFKIEHENQDLISFITLVLVFIFQVEISFYFQVEISILEFYQVNRQNHQNLRLHLNPIHHLVFLLQNHLQFILIFYLKISFLKISFMGMDHQIQNRIHPLFRFFVVLALVSLLRNQNHLQQLI